MFFFFFKMLISCLFSVRVDSFFFISWRLITLQYCSGFCHTLKSVGFIGGRLTRLILGKGVPVWPD